MKLCDWCREKPVDVSRRQRFCGRKCRQAAWRLARLSCSSDAVPAGPGLEPGARFAYADPPYLNLAHYYKNEPSYGGEVDHAQLIARLQSGGYAGWALSTSPKALRQLLPLVPEHAHLCPWVKPIGVPPLTYGLHTTWEALIVVGGRKRRPGVRDFLYAQPARKEGTLIGRKPIAFCAFLFDALGMLPGDTLDDLFPGTGIVSRAWAELGAARQSSLVDERQLYLDAVKPPARSDGERWVRQLARKALHTEPQQQALLLEAAE